MIPVSAIVTSLYDIMGSAYSSSIIREHSRQLGHVPLIEHNPVQGRIRTSVTARKPSCDCPGWVDEEKKCRSRHRFAFIAQENVHPSNWRWSFASGSKESDLIHLIDADVADYASHPDMTLFNTPLHLQARMVRLNPGIPPTAGTVHARMKVVVTYK